MTSRAVAVRGLGYKYDRERVALFTALWPCVHQEQTACANSKPETELIELKRGSGICFMSRTH